MRSYSSALALVLLAIITECLGARSDRSRQRSGPVRRVPVAADIKRDVDFDCPEEFGYYPHPTDCTLYYVCVFGGALQESCTGGLMYSHELQTCDWPRNVGCDGTSAIGGEDLERLNEREPPLPPPPPPPRRTPPPPSQRVQPNPVVTSRGQPKFNRAEYEKQQQLYAEVDELPPVEEIESDRQQRVYRGQPSTIGQVQKDRDGYGTQVVSSGRTFNSNIIPASLSQSSKIGSFSFGSQVDDRRTAIITPAPQSYSEDSDHVTDSHHDRHLDIETNEINVSDVTDKSVLRRKRETVEKELHVNETSSVIPEKISDRNDSGEEIKYFEINTESIHGNGEIIQDDIERGKRQIGYYLKNGYKNPGKNWANVKPIKIVGPQQSNYNRNIQSIRYQPNYSGINNNNNYYETTRRPFSFDNNFYSMANPSLSYQIETSQSERPFRPSLPDPVSQKYAHNPINPAIQIITKSPPISSLRNDYPFSSLTGGFYNNAIKSNTNQNNQYVTQIVPLGKRPNNPISYQDSSLLPSTVITGKPIPMPTSPRTQNTYRQKPEVNTNDNQSRYHTMDESVNQKQNEKRPTDEYYDDDDSNEDDESSSEEDEDDKFEHDFPKPPYEFTHPNNKYADVENPFANPNFDFDAFLINLSNGQYTPKPKIVQNAPLKTIRPTVEVATNTNVGTTLRTLTLDYKGISTSRPFTVPIGPGSSLRPSKNNLKVQSEGNRAQIYQFQRPQSSPQSHNQQQQHQSLNENFYTKVPQQTTDTPFDAVRPKIKPPNFKDDRQLPISYSFSNTPKQNYDQNKVKGETQETFTATQNPHEFVTGTGRPIFLSTPKQQYIVKSENIVPHQSHLEATGNPYVFSTIKPHNAYISYKQSTSKPLTTIANEQLSALQQYWNNPSTVRPFSGQSVTIRPSVSSNNSNLESELAQAFRSTTQFPIRNHNILANIAKNPVSTTNRPPVKRRPIPKPSPEMNDYYYDDEYEQYYEPPVKPKYMPSSEVKPQRPLMAQNYKEYDDSYENSEEETESLNQPQPTLNRPINTNPNKPESITKNHNDLSIVTKVPIKDLNKNVNGKIAIPVLVDFASPTPSVLIRPEISNYGILHHVLRNQTVHMRKPAKIENGPYTPKPPKYLNQTTLRPYTVRHRLAKPTAITDTSTRNDDKQTRGRLRHQNIVAQMKITTPRDNQNQETRITKTNHDDKSNSLEPTESVNPVSYSASPRPKMLYNGSQSYTPDQYDPYYAVYDEDGELYKDTDYVQQYNIASLRPAVQQTYRGTPPPARRPVETYTARPVTSDDYDDDALIQGQITKQNQYQSPIRHSTRGEGNELGYDYNPSSVRTTLYETTSISTTPRTTSTSTTTTTQRSTTAPYTEAMTPSRYTPRSSTDENPTPKPSSDPSDTDTVLLAPSTTPSVFNFSSLAKPFEKTDNLHRLQETLPISKKILTSRQFSHVTNNNDKISVEVARPPSNRGKKKVLSLTTGFSIRRNPNNTNNTYTLTVHSRPLDENNKLSKESKVQSKRFYYNINSSTDKSVSSNAELGNQYENTSEHPMRRKYTLTETTEELDIPIHITPMSRTRNSPIPKVKITTPPPTTTTTTKYYLKTVIKRPTALFSNNEDTVDSTENTINSGTFIETEMRNTQTNFFTQDVTEGPSKWEQNDISTSNLNEPVLLPYRTLDNLRKNDHKKDGFIKVSKTSTTSTTRSTIVTPKQNLNQNAMTEKKLRSEPSYYSYRVEDDSVPDQTTEAFSGKVKHVIQSFFNNLMRNPNPQIIQDISTTTVSPTTPRQRKIELKVANIGFQKITGKNVDEKPLRNNVKRLQIITEPNLSTFNTPSFDTISFTESNSEISKHFSSSTSAMTTINTTPLIATSSTHMKIKSSTNKYQNMPKGYSYQSKFSSYLENKTENPLKEDTLHSFQNVISEPSTESILSDANISNNQTKSAENNFEPMKPSTEGEWHSTTSEIPSVIASTTSTTKATTTLKFDPTMTTTTTKSLSFPTRASRVNTAIKLAVKNLGSGRRSYQSPSKCSSDNSLQANPKCNEIKYQRPTSTRARGSAHYTTSNKSESPQPAPNRGTPPTRSRPTLKPSTAIVSKTTEFVDIYAHPPSRPAPVYPQPTPDKTAAKCRQDVCLLPDCYCGGKEIPGELPVESVPQIVLLTFDDSVNDLNKGLYADLFEKGRVNPNGCPITATFYVSHEWTDYSQVQNLYSAGHEMASHTISHSFGEQFSQKKWNREVSGQREILAAYGGVKLEDVRGMRAPFLSVGGNKMFKMLYDSNFTYDSSLPVYENKPPSWPYTLDYKLFHDCMIPPCPTKSYPGVWEVPMVMWQDLNGGRCSMGDACANPPEAENVYKMILKNFDRHYTTNRAPFGLFYHAAWFTQPHHKEGFIMFLDFINKMPDVWIVTNWQALQWVRDPTPISRMNNFQPFQCNYQDRPKKCNNPKVCNLWHKSGVRYMRTCQPCPEIYPWTGKSGIRSSRIDNEMGE